MGLWQNIPENIIELFYSHLEDNCDSFQVDELLSILHG